MRKIASFSSPHLASEKQPKYDQSNQVSLTPRRVMAEIPQQVTAP
jgi:hypothetical protein